MCKERAWGKWVNCDIIVGMYATVKIGGKHSIHNWKCCFVTMAPASSNLPYAERLFFVHHLNRPCSNNKQKMPYTPRVEDTAKDAADRRETTNWETSAFICRPNRILVSSITTNRNKSTHTKQHRCWQDCVQWCCTRAPNITKTPTKIPYN